MSVPSLPFLSINTNVARTNIQKMAQKAMSSGVEFRPHFKTHQSKTIGNWYKDTGVTGITVSSLSMAEFFATDGWTDITIAFPVNILEANRLNSLAKNRTIHVLAVHPETVVKLSQLLTNKVGVYVELDPGYGRSGVEFTKVHEITELLDSINDSDHLTISGFYTHAGHSYKCRSSQEIEQLAQTVLTGLAKIKQQFKFPICFGDTPSCSVLETFGVVDQISPGNFVFYDWMQTQIGSCCEEQIAVTMKCAVVAKYATRSEFLVHGGAVHFSKEYRIRPDGLPYFGIIKTKESDWIKRPYLTSISQEHGIVACDEGFYNSVKVGDVLEIYPIHSCLTANLMRGYIDENGNELDHLNSAF